MCYHLKIFSGDRPQRQIFKVATSEKGWTNQGENTFANFRTLLYNEAVFLEKNLADKNCPSGKFKKWKW